MQRRHIAAAAAAAAAAALLTAAVPASAEPEHDHGSFGAHVSHHARMMGFDGDHNPGMHQGAAGWDHGG